MTKAAEFEGLRFERLLVKARVENGPSGSARWLCLCDCGGTIVIRTASLKNGNTRSCGCLGRELTAAGVTKHGQAKPGQKTRLYFIWNAMISRCRYDHPRNRNYYGRGITVCDDWNTFNGFLQWSKESGYVDTLTLERRNNDKNYCPENCTWIPRPLQQRNRRNVPLSKDGVPCFLLARQNGITYDIYRRRKDKLGWTPEESATIPIGSSRP